ncbi:MAG: TetR/AcrR family transcriptional regulator [Burkholderiales bacterium]|nr:TetR/AcrR family transcriptional regulator [Burkholderiales bacterium]
MIDSKKRPARRRPSPPGPAEQAQHATAKHRIVAAAVDILVTEGVARTSTLKVQQRAGVSRGALLHHFPTHAVLLSATVAELVRQNEAAVRESLERLSGTADPVERAVRVLSLASIRPSFMAELELWAVARTDADLRAALSRAERDAKKDSDRVLLALFAPFAGHPALPQVVAMTNEFVRGLALSSVLRSPVRRQQLVAQWIHVVKTILEARE